MEQRILYPGITLHTQRESRFKNEYLSVDFIISGELLKRAHASLLSAVMLCGCRKYPDDAQLEGALLDLYDADLLCGGYALGELYIQPFSMISPIDRFLPGETHVRAQSRDLLFDFMLDPLIPSGAFKRSYVAYQKKNRLDALKGEKVNRPRYALRCAQELLFEGEQIVYPTKEYKKDLHKITPESLYSFYRDMLQRAQIEIFYFGEEDPDLLAEDLSNRLSPLFTPKDPIVYDTVSPMKSAVKRKTERLTGEQSTLCIGYKTPIVQGTPDYTALCLMREMLCISPLSLIFTTVREKQSLCYYCADRLFSGKGGYILWAGVDSADAEKAERSIDEQLERLKTGNYDEALFLESKRMMINSLNSMKDSPQGLEGWNLRRILSGAQSTPDAVAERISSLTKEDVRRAAESMRKDCVFLLKAQKPGKSI